MNKQPEDQTLHDSEEPEIPSSQAFLSTLIALVVAGIFLIAMPLSYLGSFPLDIWTLVIIAIALMLFRRFLSGKPNRGGESEEETWVDYSIGMVHEVKNQLMDFHPEHYGDPATLADYLENTRRTLDETIAHLRKYAEDEEVREHNENRMEDPPDERGTG